MTSLERRLAETERALFFALAQVHQSAMVRDDYSSPSCYQEMKQSILFNSAPMTQNDKKKLLDAWAENPLGNRAQAQSWFEMMRAETVAAGDRIEDAPIHADLAESSNRAGQQRILGGEGTVKHISGHEVGSTDQYEETVQQDGFWSSQHSRLSQSPFHNSGDRSIGSQDQAASRASKVAQENRNIYF